MNYMKPMLTLETFTFKPNFLEVSSKIDPEPEKPVIEENNPVQELDDAFKEVFNFG